MVKYIVGKIIVVFAGFALSITVTAQSDSLNRLVECRERTGLPNFFRKLQAGGAVTIGYLGGSITAAANGWRDQSVNWFQQQYPQATIRQINAGVGGTGSDLGVFRVKHDVLEQQPDLVFVEFAVNDGGLAPARIHQAMEGIVRQIWRHNKRTDICFVYTLSGNMLPVLQEGRLWPSMLAMEQIAQHYGIPSVMFGKSVADLVAAGSLIFQSKEQDIAGRLIFSEDNVHPNTHTGHRLYTEALIRAMQQMQQHAGSYAHPLHKIFTGVNWENAKMLPVTELLKKGKWIEIVATPDTIGMQFRSRFPQLWKTTQPGASLRIRLKGSLAGLYDLIGPGCGQYSIAIDKQQPKLYPRFDKYGNYYRSAYFLLPELPEGIHDIEWTCTASAPDKMAILKQNGKDPGKELSIYQENACYAGWLLIIGTLK